MLADAWRDKYTRSRTRHFKYSDEHDARIRAREVRSASRTGFSGREDKQRLGGLERIGWISQKQKRTAISGAGAIRLTPAVRVSAYHEAGHAVAAVFLGLPVYSASILPDKADDMRHQNPLLRGVLEHVHSVTTKRRDLKEHLAIVALAGPRAQKQHNPHGYRRYHGAADYDNATKLAMRVAQGSEGATLILRYWQWSADGLVRVRWPKIAAVAAALLEHGTLKPLAIRQAIRTAS